VRGSIGNTWKTPAYDIEDQLDKLGIALSMERIIQFEATETDLTKK